MLKEKTCRKKPSFIECCKCGRPRGALVVCKTCSDKTEERVHELEIALRRLISKARGVNVYGAYSSDDEDDRVAYAELHLALEMSAEILRMGTRRWEL